MTHPEKLTWKDLFVKAEPATLNLINTAHCFEQSEALQSLALLAAAIAITKRAGFVDKQEFLNAASFAWDTQRAQFETIIIQQN